MATIQPIILAAGASRRFGRCKLLLTKNGKSLLQRCCDKLRPLDLPAPITITGAWHRELALAHPQLDLRENRDWPSGMGASLAFAVRQLPEHCAAALVLLADQVAVERDDIQRLLDCWHLQGNKYNKTIVCSFYSGRRGVPAIFPRHTFARLTELRGDRGARDLLRNAREDITALSLENAAIDIDTQQDWQAYQNGESQCN